MTHSTTTDVPPPAGERAVVADVAAFVAVIADVDGGVVDVGASGEVGLPGVGADVGAIGSGDAVVADVDRGVAIRARDAPV